MRVKKIKKRPEECNISTVKVTEMGHFTELKYMQHKNNAQNVRMLPGGEECLITSTGEIIPIVHGETRADSWSDLYMTFANIRAVINTNVTDVDKVRWCTLTYAENMTDTKRLYRDFQRFHQRFKYYCKNNSIAIPEYIVIMEPQARGAWHAHLLYIWENKAPFIANDILASLWNQGFVQIKKLANIDNVGAYLSAYLGNVEYDRETIESLEKHGLSLDELKIKEIETMSEGNKKNTKYYQKGARLAYYPAKFNIMRCSRGIKRPITEFMTVREAKNKVLDSAKIFEKALEFIDEERDFSNIIIREQYKRLQRNE